MHSDLCRAETFQLECRRMYRMIPSPRNDDCLTEISRVVPAKTLAFLPYFNITLLRPYKILPRKFLHVMFVHIDYCLGCHPL